MKKIYFILATLLIAVIFCGCKDSTTDDGSAPPSSDSDIELDDAYTGSTFQGETVIMGIDGQDADQIQQSLLQLCPNIGNTVSENTKLLILPELSKKYEKEIATVYNNGGIVAVTHPTYDKVKSWFESQDWDDMMVNHKIDDALLFSFANQYHCCVVENDHEDDVQVSKEEAMEMEDKNNEDFFFKELLEDNNDYGDTIDDDDSSDTVVDTFDYEDKAHNKYYTYLSSWVDVMNQDIEDRDEDAGKVENAKQLFLQRMARAGSETKATDVASIFKQYNYSDVINYKVKELGRKQPACKPDSVSGNFSITVSFSIYQIHCYEDSPTPGDYYLIEQTSGLASDKMFKGKWSHAHFMVKNRLCGFMAEDFRVEFIPWDADNNRPYPLEDVELIGEPLPSTTVGQTSYQNGYSFNIGSSYSISASAESSTSPKGASSGEKAEIGSELSFGWSWSDNKTRNISDIDIVNYSGVTTQQGKQVSKVSYGMVFNNLPKFYWWDSLGFRIGDSQAFRSTVYVTGAWVWHDKTAKDNSDKKPISINVNTKATYGIMSFATTKVDFKHFHYDYAGNLLFNLKPFPRTRCGVINITNDFEKKAIASIQVYAVKNGQMEATPVWETKNTLISGKTFSTPALKIADSYMIYFTTIDGEKYKYSTYPTKEIELGFDNTVYASHNFTKM